MAQIGFFGMLAKIYAAVGTAADAVGNLADAANNVSKVAALKSSVYLQETTLEDEARIEELKLRLSHRLDEARANPALIKGPEEAAA